MRTIFSLLKTVLILALFAASILAPGELSAQITNGGFESGTTGWTGSGFTTSTGETVLNWNVQPADGQMGRVTPGVAASTAQSTLGLTSSQLTGISNITNVGYVYQDINLTAGQEITVYWNYVSQDYSPYDDGTFACLTRSGEQQFKILARTFGTSDIGIPNTNAYGSTGWHTVSFTAGSSGTYRLGLGAFNWSDQAVSPILYIDDAIGGTSSPQQPTVSTSNPSNISNNSATLGGQVTSAGTGSVTDRGIVYSSSNSSPTIGNGTQVQIGTGLGSYSTTVSGLTNGATYYVRAYATSSGGTSYGGVKQFTTLSESPPTVSTGSISNINENSATGRVTVSANGGATIIEYGVVFGTSSNPTTSNFKSSTNGAPTLGSEYTFNLTGLSANTTYYVRGFAANSAGTGYGTQTSFKTAPPVPVATAATLVGESSFRLNWNASTGAIKYYLDISTSSDFSSFISGYNNKDVGNVTNYKITGLSPGTNYYYRLRAYNGDAISGSSNTIAVTTKILDNFLVEAYGGGSIQTQTAGEPFNIRVTARDEENKQIIDYTGTAVITSNGNLSNGSQQITSFTTSAFNGGVLNSESVILTLTGDDKTITATNGEKTGTSNVFTVMPGPINNYTIAANPDLEENQQTVMAGVAFDVLVKVYDEFGNLKTDYDGDNAVVWTTTATPSRSGDIYEIPDDGLQTFNLGIATIGNFVFYDAEEEPTITITDGPTSSPGTTEPIVVLPNELNSFTVEEYPEQTHSIGGVRVTAGNLFSVKVTARDVYLNIKRDYDGHINFKSSNDAIVEYPAELQKFALEDGGFRVFTDAISIPTTGSYWLRVADSPYAFKTGDLQNIIVGPGVYNSSVSELVATSTTTGLTAGDYVDVLLTPRDADGNLMCDCQNVAVFLNGEGNDWDSDPDPIPVNDNHDGTYTASVRITELGANTITATLDGVELTDQINVAVEYPAAPSLVVSTITPSPASITTDEYSEIVLQLKDEFGNNRTTDDGTITFITDLGGLGANNGSQTVEASYVGGTSGQYTVTLFASFDEVNHGVGYATISAEADFTDVNHTDGTFTETPTVTITEGLPDLTTSTISASPSSMTTDESSAITVQLKDHLGNNIQNSRGDISLAATIGALTSVSDNGDGTYSATLSGDTQGVNGTGTSVITGDFTGDESALAVAGAISDDEEVEITEGLPDVSTIDISVASAAITADDSTMVTVQLKDQFGNLIVNDRGTVTLSVSPIGVIDNGTATGAADITAVYQSNGSYTAIFKLNNSGVGTATITGSIDESAITDNALVEVSHGVATQLAMNTQPAHTTNEAIAGEAFSTQPKVEVHDQWGNIVTSDNATVVSAATGSAGTDVLQGNTSTTVSGGIATFAGLNYETAEDMNIEFTSGSLAAVTSNTLSVVHAIPDYMVITGSATQTAGIAQTITVKVFDQFGNQALRFDGDKMISFNGANNSPLPPFTPTVDDTDFGTLTTLSFTDGVATASMKLFKEETAYIEASHSDSEFSDSYTGGANLSIEAVNPNGLEVVVEQATPDYFEVTIENDLSEVTAGSQYSIFVKAFDQYNNPATNYSGDKVLVFSGAAISPSPSTSPTIEDKDGVAVDFGENVTLTFDGNGEASATMILYKAETGIQIVAEESVPGVTTGSGYELDLDVNPAVANYFAVTGTGVQTAGASQTITVTAYDYWNNVATGYQGAKDVTFSGASDSPDSPKAAVSPTVESIDFGTATTMTFNSGVSTGLMVLTKVETAEVKASENAIVTPDEYDLDVVVSHAANNYFAVTGASTQTAGVAQNITVTMYDAYNNIATSYDGDKLLTFSGANPSLYGNIPEVISTDFGTETTVTFINGIANNVAMVLYDAADELQDALVGVTNGTETAAGLELAVNVEYNTATNLRVDTEPSVYVRAGELLEQQPVISIRDAYGNLVDDNTTVVSATANGADVLQGTTDLTAENGIIAYTDLSYELMETITIDFDASPVLTPVTSGSVTVDHNATAKFVYSTIPDYIYAGGQRGAYTVERYDAYDNLVNNVVNPDGSDASSDETVYLYSADSDVSTKFYDVATGGSSVTAVAILNNQTSADFWYYSQVEGHHLITASDKISLDDPDVDVQNATDILEVKPAALSHFIVSGVGTDVGEGWTEHYYGDRQTVTVEAIDIFGNRKINYNGSITFSLTDQEANEPTDAGNNYPEDYTFTALDSGIHTFTNAILFERPSFEHPDYPNVNEWWVTVVDLAQPSKYGSQVKIKVLARPITITAINKTKQYYGDVYDLGSTEFTVTSGYGNPEIYAGDDSITNVTLISAGTASAATVGDYNIVPSNATGINEIDTSYYDITYTVGTLTVEPRPITITVDAGQSKVYSNDNTTDPTFTYAITSASPFDALVNGDQFIGAMTREAGEDVGLYDVSLTGLDIVEGENSKMANYDITFVNDNQFEITKYPLTLSNFVVDNKVYDATDTAYISSFETDLISGDELTFDTTANFVSRHVNWDGNSAVDTTVIYEITISGGADAGNYLFATDGENEGSATVWMDSTLATISQYPINVTAQSAIKVYDGNNLSDMEPVVDALKTGDAIVTVGSQIFDTKLVGTGKILTPSGTVIDDGNGGNNYSITYVDDNSGVINQRALTIAVDAGQTKVYGENDPAAFTYSITAGSLAEGDAFSGGLSRDAGEDVDSYAINKNTLTIVDTAIIVTGITGEYSELNAVYHYIGKRDRFDCYVHENIPEVTILSEKLANDYEVAYLYSDGYMAYGTFAHTINSQDDEMYTSSGANWETQKVEFEQIVVEPVENNIESNYNFTYENLNEFTISQLEVAVTADAGQHKTYGEVDPALTFTSVPAVETTLDNGHVINFSGSLARVAGEDAGLYAINQGTLDNTNYNISYTATDFEIEQLDVTVTADADQSKTYGDLDPELTFVSNPVVGAELANAEVIGFSGTLDRVAGEDVGFYHIGQGSLDNSNYNITFELDSLEITQLDVTVTADADQSKTYGELDPELTFVSSPVVGAELANAEVIGFSGSLDRVAGEDVGFYHIGQGSLDNSNYNITYELDSLEITQLDVTVTADADQSKTYGELDPEFTWTSYPAVDSVLANNSVIGFTGGLGRVAGEDVGSYAYTLGTLVNTNYNVTLTDADFEITKRAITLVANDQVKTYGNGPEAGIGHADYWTLGTTEYTVSTTDGDGMATGETIDGVTFTSAGEARLADIGTYTISIDANSESGSGGFKLSNYDVSYDDATLTVEKRILHLSNFAADNKLYDGTTVATGLGFDDDRVPGDNLSFQRDADFEDANVGTEKVVIYNSVIISGGADINNYVLETNTDHWKTGPNRVISAAPITVSIVAEDKEYDGNTDATVTLSGNFLAGDDVQLTYVSALFDDAEIGDGKTVTVTGIALTGSDAGQYTLASTSGSATASIVNLQREQNLGLTAGWNLISVGLRPNGSMKLIDVLQPLIDDGTLLKVMDEQGRTIENLGGDTWFESIGDLLFTEGYQLKVSENTSLLVEGIPVELPMDIELVQGWNMISFPALNEQDAMEVLQALIDNGYLLKAMDEKGSSIEELAGSWYNFIGNFVPGKGYKVKVSQACTLTINEVSTKSLTTVPGLLASSSFSPVFTGNGFNHMNIVLAELYQKGIKTGDEIGIFDGDLCVGSVTIDDYNYLNNMISIPVSSNDGMTRDANGFIAGNRYSISILRNGEKQEVEFDIISGPEQFVVGATSVVALSSELGIGDVDERNSNVYGVKLYPNPFTTMMVIEVVQPEGDDLEIDIYDIQGRKVKTIEYGISTGHDKVRWDGNNQSGESVKPGLYYIRVNGKYSGNVLKQ
nr:MBG domain-containing protein [uncultured Draconibacterium sp.]